MKHAIRLGRLGRSFPGWGAMALAMGCASTPAPTAAPAMPRPTSVAPSEEPRPAAAPGAIQASSSPASPSSAGSSPAGSNADDRRAPAGAAVDTIGAAVAAESATFEDGAAAKQDDPAVDLEAALEEASALDERLDAEAEGRPLRLLISLDAKRPLPVGSAMSITLSRLAGSEEPPVPVAARRIDVAGRMGTIEVELPLRHDRVIDQGRYAVSARIDAAGHLTAITTTPMLLEAHELAETVKLELEGVPGYADE